MKSPHPVTPATKFEGPTGFITPSFEAGALVLKNERGQFVRLSWEEEAKSPSAAANRRRLLPAGTYSLVNFRIIRRDAAGREWYLSGIPHAAPSVVVRAGTEQRVHVDDSIHFKLKLVTSNGLMLQAPIMGAEHSGVTIYADGKRIPMNYRITDSQGTELAAGSMNYG